MPRLRPPILLLVSLLAALGAAPGAAAATPEHVPGQVIVKREGEPARVIHTTRPVAEKVRELRARGDVEYAAPNVIARAAGFVPNDPGTGQGWQAVQWNFLPGVGVDAPTAWQHLIDAGRPGGRGVRVAVLDTGVAYRDHGRFRRSPDLNRTRFVRGYDFVGRDRFPVDENGHGTHVASTIAESTNNGRALTGLAYGASIMPVRVLDRYGEGDAARIADAIRWSVRRRAQVITLSLRFGTDVGARDIPELLQAIYHARRKGVLVVGATGNEGRSRVAFPARSRAVMAVAATTERGCLSDYSNTGSGIDLVAPGGGRDASIPDAGCQPGVAGRPIFQLTFDREASTRRFFVADDYEGTSMAVPHVAATAALVIASRVLGARPTPGEIERRLEATARDLGPKGRDDRYGAGLLDAGAATDPRNRAGLSR